MTTVVPFIFLWFTKSEKDKNMLNNSIYIINKIIINSYLQTNSLTRLKAIKTLYYIKKNTIETIEGQCGPNFCSFNTDSFIIKVLSVSQTHVFLFYFGQKN